MPADNPLEFQEEDSVEAADALDSFEPLNLDDEDFNPVAQEPIMGLESLEVDDPSGPEDLLSSLAPVETKEALDQVEPLGSLEALEANEPFDAIPHSEPVEPTGVIEAIETLEDPAPLSACEIDEPLERTEAPDRFEATEPLATLECVPTCEVDGTSEAGSPPEALELAASPQAIFSLITGKQSCKSSPANFKALVRWIRCQDRLRRMYRAWHLSPRAA